MHIDRTEIKSHTDFPKHNCSDCISKWAAQHILVEPHSHTPGTTNFIYQKQTPIPSKIFLNAIKHILPSHANNNLQLSLTPAFIPKLLGFPVSSFNGLQAFANTSYQPHYILNTFHCPLSLTT